MDWSKAKNIFIIAFLLLNLLLAYQLLLKNNENIHSLQWTSNNMDELEELLKQQDIILNIEIPKEAPEMHFLQAKLKYYKNEEDQKIEVESVSERYMIESILEENIYKFEQYQFSPKESDEKKHYIYYQYIDKYPIFAGKLEVNIKEERTIQFSQNYYQGINQGLDRKVISSYSALRTVLDQQIIPKGSEIKQIQLGYHGQNSQTATQLLTPAWKIIYQTNTSKEEVYVNAMTGGLQNILNY